MTPISNPEFALEVHPMPGVPDRLICRWQKRVYAAHGAFWDTILITTIEPRFEKDMLADLQAFASLNENERQTYIAARIRNSKPYSGRCLPDAPTTKPAGEQQMALF